MLNYMIALISCTLFIVLLLNDRSQIKCTLEFFPKCVIFVSALPHTSKGPSDNWLRSFLKRHPEILIRTPDNIDCGSYWMANTTVMNEHLQLLG